jgi:ATP phosphoribosyltransferase regulatory subunit
MIHQPPAGARDILPLEVAQKFWINDKLQKVFQRWGYQRIVTSTLEWLDTLMAGGAIESPTVIQLQNNFSKPLGLRPELTASIARAVVTRMGNNTFPQRLCYRANVFRNPPQGHHGRQLEFYQAGVELLFAPGVLADGEILLLVANSLKELGIKNWSLILGEADLTRSLLTAFPEELIPKIRHCLATLDRVELGNLSLNDELKEKALDLFDLRGCPEDVFNKLAQMELKSIEKDRVKNLQKLIQLLQEVSGEKLSIVLDLSLVKNFDYYTGIVFEVVTIEDNQSRVLGQGGRYDQLLGLYHPQKKSCAGIGFSLNVEEIHASLQKELSYLEQTLISDCLVAPKTPDAQSAAFIHAQKLREDQPQKRIEIDLGVYNLEEIKDYARSRAIPQITWVSRDGNSEVETL